jgi:hypothetical protein
VVKDIRLADNIGQALKGLNDRIEQLARKSSPVNYARYERTAAGTTAAGTNQNNQLAFATSVATSSAVAASGTGNTAFTLGAGKWMVNAGARLVDGAALTSIAQLSLAAGASASWAAASAKAAQNLALNSAQVSILVVSDGTSIITANLFCPVQRTWEVSGLPHVNFIEFMQI